MTTLRIDLIIKKDPHYGDEPRQWRWDYIAKDTHIKGCAISVLPHEWTASVPAPRGWETHFLSLEVGVLHERPRDYGYAYWVVDQIFHAVLAKNAGMNGKFEFVLHDWKDLTPEPMPEEPARPVAAETVTTIDAVIDSAEPWPFATDVVSKDRIIPGGLTVAELRTYIQLRDDGCLLPEEAFRLALLDARFNGRDPIDAAATIATRNGDINTALAVAWLVDQIPNRTKEG